MIIRVLVFFVCASIGTELRTAAFNKTRFDKGIDEFPDGLSMYDMNGRLVPLTKERGAPRSENGKIIFKLYTKRRPTVAQELIINDASTLRKGGFNPSKPTYIITHGWISDENSPSCTLIRDAYLAHTDSNVIIVDWSSYSMSIYYIDVTYEVEGVGKRVKRFIKWLYENGLKADDLTLIGHSLGAHVMGIAGYKLKPKVNNIVGLDPARPMFSFADNSEKLSKNDAKHVQIIHTNAGGLGYMCRYGHSDFYPNGGVEQPGCCGQRLGCRGCSHYRAVFFFAESISQNFVGTACRSYDDFEADHCGKHPQTATMGGLNLASVPPGTYYLRTGSKKPFSSVRLGSVSNRTPAVEPQIVNAVCSWVDDTD